MNFKITKWKVIFTVLVLVATRLSHYLFTPFEDSNLLVMTAPGILTYLIWSLIEKKRRKN